jgi:hypothetical protein
MIATVWLHEKSADSKCLKQVFRLTLGVFGIPLDKRQGKEPA